MMTACEVLINGAWIACAFAVSPRHPISWSGPNGTPSSQPPEHTIELRGLNTDLANALTGQCRIRSDQGEGVCFDFQPRSNGIAAKVEWDE